MNRDVSLSKSWLKFEIYLLPLIKLARCLEWELLFGICMELRSQFERLQRGDFGGEERVLMLPVTLNSGIFAVLRFRFAREH
jgi:hypothetical protein